MNRPQRLLVIGLDGATFDVLEPLCQAGHMPQLHRLIETGASGRLRSTLPPITPVAWSSFLTGCTPQHHGVVDFQRLDRDGRYLVLNNARSLRCPTILDFLVRSGRHVVSLNLPMTYPPRWPGSIVVGGFDSPSTAQALAPYPEFANRLRRRAADFSVQAIWRLRPRETSALHHALKQTEDQFRARVEAARIADELCDWSLMVVQFQELDGIQHRLWDRLCEAIAGSNRPGARAVRATLANLDERLSDLCSLADRRNAAVCIVSDHGFGSYVGTVSSNNLLREAGLVKPARGLSVVPHAVSKAGLRLHKWFYRRMQPEASAAALRRPLQAQFPLDWRRTLAWSPHGDLGAMVYLNSAERFGRGPLRSDRQRSEVLGALYACFAGAVDPQNGAPLFSGMIDVADRFGCDPIAKELPDCIAVPAPGFHTQAKLRGTGRLSTSPAYSGTHRREGIWILNGRGIQPMRRDACIEDMAPTLLALLDVRTDGPFDGSNLAASFETARGVHGSSAGPAAAPAAGTVCTQGWHYSPGEQRLIEERLQALGYLQ